MNKHPSIRHHYLAWLALWLLSCSSILEQDYQQQQRPRFYQQRLQALDSKPNKPGWPSSSPVSGPVPTTATASHKQPTRTLTPFKFTTDTSTPTWSHISPILPANACQHIYPWNSPPALALRRLAKTNQLRSRLQKQTELALLLCAFYERNPAVAAAQAHWQAVLQHYPQAMLLQNILDQYSSFTRSLITNSGPQLHRRGIATQAPFPSNLSLIGQLIKTAVAIARIEWEKTLRDGLTRIRQLYWELWYLRQAIAITKTNLQLLDSLVSATRIQFKVGLSDYHNVLKVQIARDRLQVDLLTYQQQVATVRASLRAELNLPAATRLGPIKALPIPQLRHSSKQLYQFVRKYQQETRLLKLQQQRIHQMIALVREKIYPDFTRGLSYFENRAYENIGPAQGTSFFTRKPAQPRFWFGMNNAYLHEMRQEELSRRQQWVNALAQSQAQIQKTMFRLATAARKMELCRTKLIPKAAQTLKTARSAYQASNRTNFGDVLEAQQLWLTFQLDYYQQQKNYAQQFVKLEKLVGRHLRP